VRDHETVVEGATGPDRPLCHIRDTVHVVAQRQPVPVDGGGLRQVVREGEGECVSGGDADLLAWQTVAVGPGLHRTAAQVEAGLDRGELDLPLGAADRGFALGFGGGDLVAVGGDVAVRGSG
jgi:hypothetical protein